jgi:hypothetical protein
VCVAALVQHCDAVLAKVSLASPLGWAEPGGVPQGVRLRDGDVGVPGRGHGSRRRPRAFRLGRFRPHPR